MNEHSIFWRLLPELVATVIVIIGFITSRKLPENKRKNYIRKFACVGLAVIFFCLPFQKPYVSFISQTINIKEQNPENLTSIEEISRFEKDQAYNIELLKNEVENLRNELDKVNDFYGNVIQLFSMAIATGCLIFVFKKEEKELEEIQSDQISKL